MRRPVVIAVALYVAACTAAPAASPGTLSPVTPPPDSATPQPATPAPGACSLALRSMRELLACEGSYELADVEVAKSFDGKTLARIVVASRDPEEIIAAMGKATREWSSGADSFTVFAFGSDAAVKTGYDRGRLYWNNGGTVMVDVCTTISLVELADGNFELCDEQASFTFEQ